MRRVPYIDASCLEEIIELTERVERRPQEFRELETSKWLALRVNVASVGLADELRRDAEAALAAVERARRGLWEQAEVLGTRKPNDLEAASRMSELAAHLGQRPLALSRWLQKRTLARLRQVADEQRKMQKQALELSERVELAFDGEAPAVDYELLSREARPKPPEMRVFAQAFGPKWATRLLPDTAGLLDDCVNAHNAANNLVERLDTLARAIGADSLVSPATGASLVLDLAQPLVELGIVPESWSDLDSLAETRRLVSAARKARGMLERAEDELFKDRDREIVEDSTVDRQMLTRRKARRAATNLVRSLDEIAREVGADSPVAPATGASLVLDLAQRLVELGTVPEVWSDLDGLAETRRLVSAAREARGMLERAEDELFKDRDREIVEDSTVDRQMLIRFRTDHQSGWRRAFGTAYRRDRKLLRSYAKDVSQPLELGGGLDLVERVLEIRSLRQAWQKTYDAVETRIGGHAAGLETDWERVERRVDGTDDLLRDWPWDRARLQTLLTNPDARAALEKANQAAHTAYGELERSLSEVDSDRSALGNQSPKLIANKLGRALDPLERLEKLTRPVVQS